MTIVDSDLARRLRAAVADELPAAVELRHRLHADPRPSGQEADTAAAVVAALDVGAGIEVAGTGRLVPVGAAAPGMAPIVLRAELDALPVVERSGLPWTSTGPYMHACAHDVHLAALVAVCRAIRRGDAPVPAAALLQPREESAPSGARDVVGSGLFERLGVRAVIGAHVQPRLPTGTVAATAGLVNASVDEFEIDVQGRTGHVGYPHTVADPVLALSAIVVALQQIPARRVNPIDGAVCLVTEIHAGAAVNIVPGQARARGTLRVMRDDDRPAIARVLTDIATHTAAAHGCTASVRVIDGEPPLRNDRALAARAATRLESAGYRVITDFRSFGADDFAYYCAAVPALMVFVGVDGIGLHDPAFVPPDDTIGAVADALLAGYLAALEQ
jgi:amidohydrolase